MQRLFPGPTADVPVEDTYKQLLFPGPSPRRPYVILNFVTTVDGQASVGSSGAAGIGSETDHILMHALRVPVDGLLHGAGTVRADNFPPEVPAEMVPDRVARGLAPQPLGAVVTRSGNLDPGNRYFSGRPPVVFTTASELPELANRLGGRADVVATGESTVDLGAALETLREKYGIRLLLCEGGPVLAYDLLRNGLLDEIFLTLAPKLGSDRQALRLLEGPPFPGDALPKLELVHVFAQESELFLRYRIV